MVEKEKRRRKNFNATRDSYPSCATLIIVNRSKDVFGIEWHVSIAILLDSWDRWRRACEDYAGKGVSVGCGTSETRVCLQKGRMGGRENEGFWGCEVVENRCDGYRCIVQDIAIKNLAQAGLVGERALRIRDGARRARSRQLSAQVTIDRRGSFERLNNSQNILQSYTGYYNRFSMTYLGDST